MHTMSLQDKLKLHLADSNATWSEGVARTAEATFVVAPGAVTAASVIDAYNAGRGTKVTIVHEGPVGDLARRSAARFGVTLLDAAGLPARAVLTVPVPALPAAAPEPLLPAHVEVPRPEPAPLVATEPAGPALPWDASVPPADPFATASVTLEVTPHDVLAMPWALEPREDEEHHEVTSTPRGPRGVTVRPTTDLHPDAKHWGLPWPRPVAPADGLAIADPKLWNNPARLESLHAGFDARATKLAVPTGASPEAGWLKKLSFDAK